MHAFNATDQGCALRNAWQRSTTPLSLAPSTMHLELTWNDDYVFVDGPTYRTRPDRLVLIGDCEPVPHCQASHILTRLAYEAPDMLERLGVALFERSLQTDPLELARELEGYLGPPSPDVFSPPGSFARIIVLERKRRRVVRPPPEVPKLEPRSFAEIAASVSLVLVDEWGNPGPSASFELLTPDGGPRSGTLDGHGEARQANMQHGSSQLRLPELRTEDVQPRASPPDGWLRDQVSIYVNDAKGVPLTGPQFSVVFDSGSSQAGALDADGTSRLEGTPSRPLRVTFANLDMESWG